MNEKVYTDLREAVDMLNRAGEILTRLLPEQGKQAEVDNKPELPAPEVDVPILVRRTWEWLKTNGGGVDEWKEFCSTLDIKSSKDMTNEQYCKFSDAVATWISENGTANSEW